MKIEDFENKFKETAKQFVEFYDIDDANKKAIKSILKYFAGIETKDLPVTKGLLIKGTVGSGKTLTFKILQKMGIKFSINNVREIVAEFNIGGFSAIEEYISKHRMIDDVGCEYNGKFYGNDTNVVEELIIRRYEKFQQNGQLTHFTTNLGTKEQIKGRYGERAYDRLTEMCSIVILGDNNESRRNKYKPLNKAGKSISDEISEQEKERMNKESVLSICNKILEGQDVFSGMYVSVYDFLKKKEILNLSVERKKEITIQAQELLIEEKSKDISKAMASGNILKAKNLNKKLFDITPDLVVFQKKIAVIDFLKSLQEFDEKIEDIIK